MSKVRYKHSELPILSKEREEELKTLAKQPDSEIDYSDIPALTDDFWKNATPNPFYKPTKKITTIRLDSDILAWLKSKGERYQTRINAILRDAMLEEIHH
jgi:uncharacterized protein (DUF4415 family)